MKKQIEDSGYGEIIWRVEIPKTGEFPAIYAYPKLYAQNYLKCVGYVELWLSPQLLKDYVAMLNSLSDDPQAVLTLFYGDSPIYTNASCKDTALVYVDRESGYETYYWQDQYRNYLRISKLELLLICSGRLSAVKILPSGNIPSILFSVIFVLLLVLFVAFFLSIVSLSRRILTFSSFIRDSDPEKLTPFLREGRARRRADEFDMLTDTYNTLIRKNNSLISQIQKMELYTQQARFLALQKQIHPHFIYGTLETIRMTALQNRDREAASMIFSLSSLIRYSISISEKAVTLRDELEIARHYLSIQKIRFDNRIGYDFCVEESLLDMELPSFILQPILENAVVYGISKTLDFCTLTVEAHEDAGRVILTVSNTGLPITRQRLEEVNGLLCGKIEPKAFTGRHNGLALDNIRERLLIFFNGRASVRLALQNGRTATVITVIAPETAAGTAKNPGE